MRTVKEIVEITGVSARTLHYYDEIGLLKPAGKSEAGYRLYDDAALETLRRILFFREFGMPLKQIKVLLENPALDANQLLRTQRNMLEAERARLGRMIQEIDRALAGEKMMDFAVFKREELEEIFRQTFDGLSPEMREMAIAEFGSREAWHDRYMEVMGSGEMQAKLARVTQWYGGRDAYMHAVQNPHEVPNAKRREEAILEELCALKEGPPDSAQAQALLAEWVALLKELCQMEEEAGYMQMLILAYRGEVMGPLMYKNRNYPGMAARLDAFYGAGSADFLARAIESRYPPKDPTR